MQFNATSDMVFDDMVDYICRAMPDVLLERAIDVCTLLAQRPDNSLDDAEILNLSYAMVASYVPEENILSGPG